MRNVLLILTLSICSLNLHAQNAADRDTTFKFHVTPSINFFNGSNLYRNIAFQSNGKVLFTGGHYGSRHNGIMRLNTNGRQDTTFNVGGVGTNAIVGAVAVQSDDKIIIGGNFFEYNQVSRPSLARLNADGSLDQSFTVGTGAPSIYFPPIRAIAIQPDGKILIGGSFTQYNGNSSPGIARLNTNGSFDTTFNVGTGASNIIEVIRVLPSGKIAIGGAFGSFNGFDSEGMAILNSNGSVDTSFVSILKAGGNGPVYDIAPLNDGKFIVAGGFNRFDNGANGSANGIVRLNQNGSRDTTFQIGAGCTVGSGNGPGQVFSVKILPSGKILAVGFFSKYNLVERGGIAQLNPNGTLDLTFNSDPGFEGSALELLVNPTDGKIYVSHGGSDYQGEVLFNYHTPFSGHNMYVIRLNGSGGSTSVNENQSAPNSLIANVFPNPASQQFTLNLSGESLNQNRETTAILMNLNGKIMLNKRITELVTEFNVAHLPKGVYFLRVQNNSGLVVKKLVVQ